MRVEIWFNNNTKDGVMRCFPYVDEKTISTEGDWIRFASEKSDHTFNVNKNHVMFIEFMPTEN